MQPEAIWRSVCSPHRTRVPGAHFPHFQTDMLVAQLCRDRLSRAYVFQQVVRTRQRTHSTGCGDTDPGISPHTANPIVPVVNPSETSRTERRGGFPRGCSPSTWPDGRSRPRSAPPTRLGSVRRQTWFGNARPPTAPRPPSRQDKGRPAPHAADRGVPLWCPAITSVPRRPQGAAFVQP